MRRLYLQIYLAFLGIAALIGVVAIAWGQLARPGREVPPYLTGIAEMIGAELPPADRSARELERALLQRARRLRVDATVWSPEGRRIAGVGARLERPRIGGKDASWILRKGPPGIAVRLRDGRWLGLALADRHPDIGRRWMILLLVLAGIIALGAYPLSRRIARRLERLRVGVENLGGGDLSVRVPVEGSDEIADLARSFNRAAERIAGLVAAQRRMLASASHELRSPLTRLRVAVEMLDDPARADLKREARADITELDELIEDLLLSARLEGAPAAVPTEPVELLALLAEEAGRVGAEVDGEPVTITGEARPLRRLMRNLLENARRHGDGSPILATLHHLPGESGARLEVADRGPGIPVTEQERVFEPFHRPPGHDEGRHGGVGLGLALVREIARRHGGDARCRAREGGGTVLEVELRGAARAPPARNA